MAYNQQLANRIREALIDRDDVEEKEMFRGVTFMVDGKMCVCVSGNEMMCRIDPALHEQLAEQNGCRTMTMKQRVYKGYILVSEETLKSKKVFEEWIKLSLDFNKRAKASKKKK